jgi:hypothetical protein
LNVLFLINRGQNSGNVCISLIGSGCTPYSFSSAPQPGTCDAARWNASSNNPSSFDSNSFKRNHQKKKLHVHVLPVSSLHGTLLRSAGRHHPNPQMRISGFSLSGEESMEQKTVFATCLTAAGSLFLRKQAGYKRLKGRKCGCRVI